MDIVWEWTGFEWGIGSFLVFHLSPPHPAPFNLIRNSETGCAINTTIRLKAVPTIIKVWIVGFIKELRYLAISKAFRSIRVRVLLKNLSDIDYWFGKYYTIRRIGLLRNVATFFVNWMSIQYFQIIQLTCTSTICIQLIII